MASPVFKAMFLSDMRENYQDVVILKSIKQEEVLRRVLAYMYAGGIERSMQCMEDFFITAEILSCLYVVLIYKFFFFFSKFYLTSYIFELVKKQNIFLF